MFKLTQKLPWKSQVIPKRVCLKASSKAPFLGMGCTPNMDREIGEQTAQELKTHPGEKLGDEP